MPDPDVPASPEETHHYPPCPECGNATEYVGIDTESELSQDFTVTTPGEEPAYGSYESEIGSYSRIICGACWSNPAKSYEVIVWQRPTADDLLDLIELNGGFANGLANKYGWPGRSFRAALTRAWYAFQAANAAYPDTTPTERTPDHG